MQRGPPVTPEGLPLDLPAPARTGAAPRQASGLPWRGEHRLPFSRLANGLAVLGE